MLDVDDWLAVSVADCDKVAIDDPDPVGLGVFDDVTEGVPLGEGETVGVEDELAVCDADCEAVIV